MLATGTICCARSVRYEIVSWSDAVPTMDDGGDVPDRGNLCNLAEQAVARRSLENKIVFAKRSEEHTSELQSLMRNSYAVFCLKKKHHSNAYFLQAQHDRHD